MAQVLLLLAQEEDNATAVGESHPNSQGLTCYLLKAGSQSRRTIVSDTLGAYFCLLTIQCKPADSAWQLFSSKKAHQLLANWIYSCNDMRFAITSITGMKCKPSTCQEWSKYSSHNLHSHPHQLLHIQRTRHSIYHHQYPSSSGLHHVFLVSLTLNAVYARDKQTTC